VRTVTKTYKNGDIIYRQGEESLWAFEVLEGSVELLKETAQGQSTLARVKAGDLFGESGVLDNSPRSATAKARGAVTVRAIPRDEFMSEVEANPAIALKVMTKLAKRMKGDGEVTGVDPVREAAYRSAAANLPVPVTPTETFAPAPVRIGRPMPLNLIGERKPTFSASLHSSRRSSMPW
jgi:CRP-like cAMP-binding protein